MGPIIEVFHIVPAEIYHIRGLSARAHGSILGLGPIIIIMLGEPVKLTLVGGMVPLMEPPVVLSPPVVLVL